MKPLIRHRILEVLRARGAVTFDELIDIFAPSGPGTNPTLRAHRYAALAKNLQRARRLAHEDGETIALLRDGNVTRYTIARLPDQLCDAQTMAELTLGRVAT